MPIGPPGSAPRGDGRVTVDPLADGGRWEGWGTSLAWWANVFGERDDFADLFFTTKTVPYGGRLLPGLGLTIARYNVGACSWNTVGGESMAVSSHICRYKQIEGYWHDWRSDDPASWAWDWSADQVQRAALRKACERGAVAEMFANSPMWWMCLNHNPSGADGGENNLQPWNYREHAYHLAAVARHAADHWGVRVLSVEPCNEPSANWWRSYGTQEGCHMDAWPVQAAVLVHLREQLDRMGLHGTLIAASDENTYDAALATWRALPRPSRAVVDRVNVHGYQGTGGRRDLLYDAVRDAGKGLWNSETGDGDGTGQAMAANICLDFRWLHPTAWCYWQVLDATPGWGLIRFDERTTTPLDVETKYYVLAQFTRHVRPGMRILATGVDWAVAAYDDTAGRLAVVLTNPGPARTVTVDLSRFGCAGTAPVRRWVTGTAAGGDRYTSRPGTVVDGRRVDVPLDAASVQTLEFDGVAR